MSGVNTELEIQAHALVDRVIDNARKRIVTELGDTTEIMSRPVSSIKTYDSLLFRETEDYEIPKIEWMTIEEFNIDLGIKKLDEFVKTWEYDNSWLYCIDFLREEDDKYSKKYRYQVRWSIPTRRKPIPRATACVYFTIEVSKIKPKTYPVSVYYVFETNRLVHQPGLSRFRDRWLKDIIDTKILVMDTVTF
ncbi:A-kinase anchor protein 14-like [Lytechinus variegatus]|uniref:A-kinase anchor protein 14-like n=1 Tax=Lytechinus variegatus TaxID=7654 RepID=UPI001BB24162|nr:A-kinase anchor protein 14-like [Lytechinus variegatus]XP_041483065.1 A-kinase anchor protein 14-like [Lytechinus variegatus]XP_041483066.1 A-kinase anchor protein 14-like [Lytechinus variegatus]